MEITETYLDKIWSVFNKGTFVDCDDSEIMLSGENQDEVSRLMEEYHQAKLKDQGGVGEVSERYPKDCVLQYEDGWYITFKSLGGNIIKSHGAYKTKAMAEHDRRTLNER